MMYTTRLKNTLDNLFDLEKSFCFFVLMAFLLLIPISIFFCYILFTYLVIALLVKLFKKKKPPDLPHFYKYFILFVMLTLISTIFSIDFMTSLKDNKELFIFLIIQIYILTVTSWKKLNISLVVLMITSLLSSLMGFFFVIQKGITIHNRPTGFTSHWMTYAGFLMMVFIFFFIFIIYEKKKNIRLTIIFNLFVILAAILFSQTRSAWMGIVISLTLFIVFFKPKVLFYILPACLLLVYLLPEPVKQRMVSIVDLNDQTNRDRIHMVYTGVEIFKRYPLTGVGANNIETVYEKYQHPEATHTNPHLHNNFLQILAERGVFTMIGLTIAFVSILCGLIKKVKHARGSDKTIAVGALFVFIGFLVSGMFEYNFGDTELKFILFYFLSIPFLNLKDQQHDQTEETRRDLFKISQ